MTFIHPYRYPTAFRGQLNRLERLCPGITTGGGRPSPNFLRIEKTGSTNSVLAQRSQALRHLERLIADWRVDGETVFKARTGEGNIENSSLAEFPDIPALVIYLAFEPDSDLQLDSPGSWIEGVYLREIAYEGKFSVELTFVCQEAGWRTIETCIYADAVEIGSHICVGIIPLGEQFAVGDAGKYFESEALLSSGPAFLKAIAMASEFASSNAWNGPLVPCSSSAHFSKAR